jgi:hypothetical protein
VKINYCGGNSVSRKYGAVVGVLLATAVLVSVPSADADTPPMLPDLRQAPVGCPGGFGGNPLTCTDWDVCMVEDASAPNGDCETSGPIGAVRIRFTSSADNIGDGPLLLYGHRDSADQSTMAVRQAFQAGGGGPIPDSFATAQRRTASYTYYEPAKSHEHWHLMGFERFELRTPGGDTLVTDRKNGFCLGDRYPTYDANLLPHVPREPVSPAGQVATLLADNMCEHHAPEALDVVEGISVGSGDDYEYTVDFQWLDITHIPTGTYDLVHTVNPDRTLLEKDYHNNSSSVSLSIRWPAQGALPEVAFLRSCPGAARCT